MKRVINLSDGQKIFVYIANWEYPYIEQVIRNNLYKDITHNFFIYSSTQNIQYMKKLSYKRKIPSIGRKVINGNQSIYKFMFRCNYSYFIFNYNNKLYNI